MGKKVSSNTEIESDLKDNLNQNRAKLTILKVMVLCLRRVDLGQGLYSVHAAKVHAI